MLPPPESPEPRGIGRNQNGKTDSPQPICDHIPHENMEKTGHLAHARRQRSRPFVVLASPARLRTRSGWFLQGETLRTNDEHAEGWPFFRAKGAEDAEG